MQTFISADFNIFCGLGKCFSDFIYNRCWFHISQSEDFKLLWRQFFELILCCVTMIWFGQNLRINFCSGNIFIYCFVYFNSSEKRQKGESQNECYKKTKHPKFSKNGPFLPSADTHTYVSEGKKCPFWENLTYVIFL